MEAEGTVGSQPFPEESQTSPSVAGVGTVSTQEERMDQLILLNIYLLFGGFLF